MGSCLLVGERGTGRLACLMVLAAALLGGVLSPVAKAENPPVVSGVTGTSEQSTATSRAHELGYSLTPSTTEPYLVCPTPKPGYAACAAIAVPPGTASSGYEGGGEEEGWASKELREAYNIPGTGGSGQTVAIVDAWDDTHANADLEKYREKYESEFSPCTEENKCFKKINQIGEEKNYVKPGEKEEEEEQNHWDIEISLDIDMVSAVCPECHILLVEANNAGLSNLYAAEDEAASWTESGTGQKATVISNSWYSLEEPEETSDDKYFEHPGIPITAAGGDYGGDKCGVHVEDIGLCYPAASASRNVISVGGTELKKKVGGRGWEETVWGGSGGGCSLVEPKPSWQTDWGCAKRTDNDVAAVASPSEPVSLYDSHWTTEGGTSVATPIIAGIEAHASKAVREEGAEAFYRHSLFDVTLGSNKLCEDTYLCTAEEGYDSPTGWGTPDGPLELSAGFHAVTGEATGVTKTAAKLNGYIDPEGEEVTYHFEYGQTTSYGINVPVPSASGGSGVTWKSVQSSLTGLEEDTTYHYRLVARKPGGSLTYGQEHTFATMPWTIQSTPTPTGTTLETYEGYLYGVSCSSSTACTGVGGYQNSSNAHVTLADRWNGTEWLVQSIPNQGTGENTLQGVSCASSATCIAVGKYVNKSETLALAEVWSSEKWSIQLPLSPEGAKGTELLGVSCTSSTACTAVGRYYTKEKEFTREYLMLAERWNGEKWTIQSTPNPEGATVSALQGVSCTAVEACTAVGGYTNSAKKAVGLAEQWNGKAWTSQEVSAVSSLDSVSCTSTEACTAMSGGLTAERWNGKEWSVQSMPNPIGPKESDQFDGESSFSGVSCSSSIQCVAVGDLNREDEITTAAEVWNGTEWLVQGVSRPYHGVLNGVSCSSSTVCAAVGSYSGYKYAPEGKEALYHTVTLAESATLPLPGVPAAETRAPTSVVNTGVTLNGIVNPRGFETTYYYEYGTTISYGMKTTEVKVGSGASFLEEPVGITGLLPTTTYHFRIVAKNSVATTYGKDMSFRTQPTFVLAIGSEGHGGGKLVDPTDVAVDSSGNVWVTDTGNDRVEEFNEKGEFVFTFGKEVNKTKVESGGTEAEKGVCTAASGNVCQAGKAGSANGQFDDPLGIVMISGGDFWVTDGEPNDRVQEFNTKGEYLATFGSEGTGPGQFSEPFGITISEGHLWVTDARYYRVEEFSSTGVFIREEHGAGYGGTGNGEYAYPSGIATDSKGDVWVADAENNRVQELSPSGEYMSKFGVPGPGHGELERPMGIANESSGNVLVSDTLNYQEEEFTSIGEYLMEFGNAPLSYPQGIAISPRGAIFVANTVNGKVDEWADPAAPIEVVTQPASNVHSTEATLNGTVNPNGATTSYYFEYGPTTAYGTKTSEVGAGSGWTDVNASTTITGLTPGSYHFRVVASNQFGTTNGKDMTFETATAGDLKGMSITDPFNGTTSAISNFSTNWSALGWASEKGVDGSTGWGPSAAYPTVTGAYYSPTITNVGSGIADVATMAESPGLESRYFSLWLDMSSPGSTRSGYELTFTYVSTGTYEVKLSKWVSGTQTVLASKSSYAFTNGDSVALADQGSTVSAWTNTGSGFSELLSAGDSAFEGGNAGVEGAGNITRLTNFKVGELLTPVANTNAALEALALNDSFSTNESPLSDGGAFAALSWDNGTSGHNTGQVESGWGPYDAYSTINGAYWQKTSFADTGSGDAVAAKLSKNPEIESRYFALWLNMPNPASARSGYEVRFKETSSGVYEVNLAKWASGTETVLASKSGYSFAIGSLFALDDNDGTVSAWTKTGSEYTQLLSAGNSTYTSGYTGIEGSGNITRLKEFKSGPLPPT